MKKQILTLVIGILIGAIITTGVFLILKGNTGAKGDRMNMGEPPTMDGNSIGGPGGPRENSQQGGNGNTTTDSSTTDNTNTSET